MFVVHVGKGEEVLSTIRREAASRERRWHNLPKPIGDSPFSTVTWPSRGWKMLDAS